MTNAVPGVPGGSAESRKTSLSLWFIVAIIATGALVFWVTRDNGMPKGPQPPLSLLISEYAMIKPPVGSTPQTAIEERTKVGSDLVSARYTLTESSDAARAYYRNELSRNGWRYRRMLGAIDRWVDVYCKGSLQGSVELLSNSPPASVLAFSVSWNEISVRECQ